MKPLTLPTAAAFTLFALLGSCQVMETAQSVAEDPFGEGLVDGQDPYPGTASSAEDWDTTWGTAPAGGQFQTNNDPYAGQGDFGQPQASWGQQPDAPTHGFPQETGSRFLLLERYQQVVEERDELDLQLAVTRNDLDTAVAENLALRQELETLRTRFEEQSRTFENQQARVTELADRLVTAEIRRLEAEKRWYEAEIMARGATPVTERGE